MDDSTESIKAKDQLKIIFSLLKEISEGNEPKASDYGISEKKFGELLEVTQDYGFIKGVKFAHSPITTITFLDSAIVTLPGLQYLHDNSALMKTYKGLKEVKSWIPFAY